MNFLITSGGTKVPIDDVRHIANFSSGGFGSALAKAALRAGHRVTFLHAKYSRTPFSLSVDSIKDRFIDISANIQDLYAFYAQYNSQYVGVEYVTYGEYATLLEKHVSDADVTMLAAAVSDFTLNERISGKIDSSGTLNISLNPTDKLIRKVKDWNSETFLVGFKLLTGSTNDLVEACCSQIENASCNITVGNLLSDVIHASCRRIVLVDRSNSVRFMYAGVDELADKLIEITEWSKQ